MMHTRLYAFAFADEGSLLKHAQRHPCPRLRGVAGDQR
jgi:hypothetical protein